MVQFVLSCLPESAKVILEDPDEKQHVRVLLLSMKKEPLSTKKVLWSTKNLLRSVKKLRQ